MEIIRNFTAELENRLQEPLNFIQVVQGPRQVGKTTGLRQIAEKWNDPVHRVSADEVAPPSSDWIELNWKIARTMGENTLLVFDEIQKVPNWSAAVKRLFDEDRASRKLKVVLLGSASLSLQKGLADSLAGRYEVIRADHWNLGECREAFGWNLGQFLAFGGYPAAAELANDVNRWQRFINDSIIEPVLLKDLLSFASINKPALFRQTFMLCLAYPAMEVSLQKMLGQLQESGNVSTIKHYLEIFEGAFLIRTLQKYSGSEVRKRGSSPKIVPLNTALIHAVHDPADVAANPEWFGRVFEAAVGAELYRQADAIYYWRDGKDEVDFVVELKGRIYAIEIKSGRIRRTSGLARFIQRYPASTPVIIDREKGTRLLEGMPLLDCVP
jgi:predicted AAA+ superfamily ATPase